MVSMDMDKYLNPMAISKNVRDQRIMEVAGNGQVTSYQYNPA